LASRPACFHCAPKRFDSCFKWLRTYDHFVRTAAKRQSLTPVNEAFLHEQKPGFLAGRWGLWKKPVVDILTGTLTNILGAFSCCLLRVRPNSRNHTVTTLDMSEVHLKKGEPVDKALRRLKKKLDREQTLVQVRLHRRFEKPSARRRRKEKAA